ncbi:MAG: hypothetical protein ACI9S8_002892, partial [Chlamydiales bacterium]
LPCEILPGVSVAREVLDLDLLCESLLVDCS